MSDPYATQTQYVPADTPSPKRPLAISFAVACQFAVNVIAAYALWALQAGNYFTLSFFSVLGVYLLLQAAIWLLTWQGFNWARVVLLVFLGLAIASRVLGLTRIANDPSSIELMLQLALDLTTLYLVLRKSSRRWFGEMLEWRRERI